MRITFYSNFLNHHQLPFCLTMNELLRGQFTFVASQPIEEEQLKLGYEDMNRKYPFVLRAYDNEESKKKAMELAEESDIIIFGSAPAEYIRCREKERKLSFIYSERLLRPGTNKLMIRTYLAYLKSYLFRKKKNVYILCASHYTSHDFRMIGAYRGKYYKWGYFPPFSFYDMEILMEKKRKCGIPVILWVGRIIPLKHPEAAIRAAQYLKHAGINFEMRMIGDGSSRQETEAMIVSCGLQERVHILGSMPPESVRRNMEEASVFLFNSDYNEGWGAVVNESMNSGCAVVVSHAVGSAGFLIENGVNGIVYPYGDQEAINYWTALLIRDNEFRETLGRNAYQTIRDSWNARQGTDRLLALCRNLLENEKQVLYESGPCSPALCCSNRHYMKKVQKDLIRMKKQYEENTATDHAL